MLQSLIKKEEMTDLYFEKPMKTGEIRSLLKLLNISNTGKQKLSITKVST